MKNKIKLKFNTKQKGLYVQSGFTLIETLVAILILSLSIGALLSLAAGGFYSARYARNQIVANNLLQESIEYIRNTRDTSFQQSLSPSTVWVDWQNNVLSVDISGNPTGTGVDGCLSNSGCYVDPYANDFQIKQCDRSCPYVEYYPDNSFYGYIANYPFNINTAPYQTSFVRKIVISPSGGSPDQLIVTATISWLNGETQKNLSQTSVISNWKQ